MPIAEIRISSITACISLAEIRISLGAPCIAVSVGERPQVTFVQVPARTKLVLYHTVLLKVTILV